MEEKIITNQHFEKKEYEDLWEIARLSGFLLLKSGAEAYRVEDTAERILNLIPNKEATVLALYTGIHYSLILEDGSTMAVVQRNQSRSLHLATVQEVNEISRALVANKMTTKEAYDRLTMLLNRKDSIQTSFTLLIIALGFAIAEGGGYIEFLYTLLSSFGLIFSRHFLMHLDLGNFVPNIIKSFCVSLLASLLCKYVYPANLAISLSSSLMILFPGMSLVIGIRDIIHGDYICGGATLLTIFLSAIGLALGAVAALSIVGVSL